MTEDFLQFIWKFGLFEREEMISDTGEPVQIIHLGEHNTDSGADFQNARIKIGNTVWAGNVEIHNRSSDWIAHGHDKDRSYDNVILHAVLHYDQPVLRTNGEPVPSVELKFDHHLYDNYCRLLDHKKALPCMAKIGQIDPLIIDVWINSLVVERLMQKTAHISELLTQYRNNWEEVFYIGLARTFGFGLNAVPFEMMARSLPLSIIARHRDNPGQTEALILGQAGFLDETLLFNTYYADLHNEYLHLRKKYNLKPVQKHMWKFLRLRPVNFPTIRLTQFAALIQKSEGLFSKVVACQNIRQVSRLFDVASSAFWDTHYTFETISPHTVKRLGNDATHTIIINAVIPLLFIYGSMTGREELKDKAVAWLNDIPAEENSVVRKWEPAEIRPASAFYSQGLLQLNNMYCSKRRCLACSIGMQLIAKQQSI